MVTSTSTGQRRKNNPSSDELNQAVGAFQAEINRLHAARQFAENFERLAKEASDLILDKFLVPQELDSEQTCEQVDEIVNLILKSLTWSLTAGRYTLLDEYLLIGFPELLTALGHSSVWYIEALKYVRANHGLTGESARQINKVIDYVISALS